VAGHQVDELQEVCEAEDRPPFAYDDLRIRRDNVRPLPRHGADTIAIDAEQEPRAVSVVPLADADELSSTEGVERVRHTHKARPCAGRACILA